MQKLFNFLIRNHIFILFLFLQLIAFTFTINSLSFQKATYLNSSNKVAGSILSSYHEIEEFINLKETNRNLARENAKLKSAAKQSYFQLYNILDTVVDSLYTQKYKYIEAQVINSSFTYQNNYITINRGSRHGVEIGLGLLNADGVLGVINHVSKNYSIAVPIINTHHSTIGRIANSNHFGTIKWDGLDYQTVWLTSIQKQAKFNNGDTVYTDVRSHVYPTGIPIGIIKSSTIETKSQLYKLEIKLLPDFSSIDHVYIVKDLLKNEQLELEQKVSHEQ